MPQQIIITQQIEDATHMRHGLAQITHIQVGKNQVRNDRIW